MISSSNSKLTTRRKSKIRKHHFRLIRHNQFLMASILQNMTVLSFSLVYLCFWLMKPQLFPTDTVGYLVSFAPLFVGLSMSTWFIMDDYLQLKVKFTR